MSYRDLNDSLNDYWADRRCVKCDRNLDRRGAHCSSCMEEIQEELDHAEVENALSKKPVYAWKLLNDEFQKIFRK